ncbi:MAG TPA: hypothetical protein VNM67_24870 [Thermoanaerobaculia bacterium]|nr:hypothetical protein [Thermoanaerobaculia bacterium]
MAMDSAEETLAARAARLQARVTALEALLERRSRELRQIQKYVCHRDLLIISRVCAGLSPLPFGAFDPDFWQETPNLTPAEVEPTLEALWDSLDMAEPR